MTRLDKARALAADVQAVIHAAGLTKALATVDAAHIPSGSRYGIVVVSPPELTFETFGGDPALVWELHIIAGPAENYLAAWERIDEILAALEDSDLPLSTAKPGAWESVTNGPDLPAYTVTLYPID